MRLIIDYDSCWQNSVLSGSNNEPLPKNGRDFIATSKGLKIERKPITKDTVMGVLCRLIGDQRKLFDARQSDNYFFKELESCISFKPPINEIISNEVVYMRNTKTDTSPQHTVSGVIKNDTPLFFSEYAPQLWSILYLDLGELADFVLGENCCVQKIDNIKPSELVHRINKIQKLENYVFLREKIEIIEKKKQQNKAAVVEFQDKLFSLSGKEAKGVERKITKLEEKIIELNHEKLCIEKNQPDNLLDSQLDAVVKKLELSFLDEQYIENNNSLNLIRIYAAALYLQLDRMEKLGIDVGVLKSDSGKIQGFSVRGFNGIRDFLYRFSSGGKAKNQGSPFKDGNGQALTKANGQLEINIDVDNEKGKLIEKMIEDAGVSAFYLGKKGLAYVSNIRV